MKEMKVETSIGTFIIIKPKAGIRNRALVKAETDSGTIKRSILMIELLPKCIKKRPEAVDDTVPIDQILDDLEIEDYDKIFQAFMKLIELEGDSENDEKN
jgi:hypothetical protein